MSENKGKHIDNTDLYTDSKADWEVGAAITLLTALGTICLLLVLNVIICNVYQPDIDKLIANALKISFRESESFRPEPVERLQYMLSLLLLPVFLYTALQITSRLKSALTQSRRLSISTILCCILLIFIYLTVLLNQPLLYIADSTNCAFFNHNLIAIAPIVALPVYAMLGAFILYIGKYKSKIVTFGCYSMVFFCLADVFLYNIFRLETLDVWKAMETNSVFYAVAQVYAGKSLLVNITSEYGLFPWLLLPILKITGLSIFKFGVIMALLNVLSFLFLFIGIKKIVRSDLFSLLLFLAVLWWSYWSGKTEFEDAPRVFYQYHPIRVFFPALVFMLLSIYQANVSKRSILLPVIAICAALGIIWNLDSGIVTFGAVFAALAVSVFTNSQQQQKGTQIAKIAAYMGTALLLIIALFAVSTVLKSGSWPQLTSIAGFQQVFYISGYFMLPMNIVHFWNIPAIMYILGGAYCVYKLKGNPNPDTPVYVYLVVLGAGIFSYFQGRSFDTNITWVMYPAIILAGGFAVKMFNALPTRLTKQSALITTLFVVVFIGIADAACSLLYHLPAIHRFAYNNATAPNTEKSAELAIKTDFLKRHLATKDTVIIISHDFDAYLYAAGCYYSPFPVAGSTEQYLSTDVAGLINTIALEQYPVIYDFTHESWLLGDTLLHTIASHYHEVNSLPDGSMLLLAPGKKKQTVRLPEDANTLYYTNAAALQHQSRKIYLPDTFTIELYATLDTTRLEKSNILFSSTDNSLPFRGVVMGQYGYSLTNYNFTFGDGNTWAQGLFCNMSCSVENHIIIRFNNGEVAIYNNGTLCSQVKTGMHLANSTTPFFINARYAGKVQEMKISRQ